MLSIFKRKKSSKSKMKSKKGSSKLKMSAIISNSSKKIDKRNKSVSSVNSSAYSSRAKMWLDEAIGFEDMDRPATLDDFTMVKPLGKGSFGKVIAISSKITGKQYAMKILSKKMLMKYKMVKQIMNEIKIMRRLVHENIIRYQTHFEDKEYIFLLLDLADKGHLFSKLKKKGIFNEKEAARIMFETFKAVSYLHQHSPPIIHRDIKPENILFAGRTIKLADFGWSNTKDIIRSTYCGTRDYLAPEMITKRGHDEKLDVWTLGVLMYEVCTGKTPFVPGEISKRPDNVRAELEDNILKKDPQFPNFLSTNARDLISKLLQKHPKDRISSTEALKHPWFRTNGYRFNEEKEKVLNNIIGRSKQQLNRKKMRRLMSNEKKNEVKGLSKRLNASEGPRLGKDASSLQTSAILNYKEQEKIKMDELKEKIMHNQQKRRRKKLSLDQLSMKVMREFSKKNPDEALEELSKKFAEAKEERNQMANEIRMKDSLIRELEEEAKELKSKLLYKDNGDSYTKAEILFMEGQIKMSQIAQKRVEELEEKLKEAQNEARMVQESPRRQTPIDFPAMRHSTGSLRDLKNQSKNDHNEIKYLLKEIDFELKKSNNAILKNHMGTTEPGFDYKAYDDMTEKLRLMVDSIEDILSKTDKKLALENQKLKSDKETLSQKIENLQLKIKLTGYERKEIGQNEARVEELEQKIKLLKMELELKGKEMGYVKRSLTQANNVIDIMHKSQSNTHR